MGYWVNGLMAVAGGCFETYVVFLNARLPIPDCRVNISKTTAVSQSELYTYLYVW